MSSSSSGPAVHAVATSPGLGSFRRRIDPAIADGPRRHPASSRSRSPSTAARPSRCDGAVSTTYFISTFAPASSSCFLILAASSLLTPSLTGLGRALDQVLGFLEAEAGDRPDFLDHVDLLLAGRGQDDVELGLLGGRRRGGGRPRQRPRPAPRPRRPTSLRASCDSSAASITVSFDRSSTNFCRSAIVVSPMGLNVCDGSRLAVERRHAFGPGLVRVGTDRTRASWPAGACSTRRARRRGLQQADELAAQLVQRGQIASALTPSASSSCRPARRRRS